ncbi:hypothetical protein ACOSP7_031176 [Xanthoceras sorbifolium]
MIRKGASSTRPPLLEGSNYVYWNTCMIPYVNDERVWLSKLSQFPNKGHDHYELEFCTWKFKRFLKGKRPSGRFKGANAKKDFMPKKFDNDKGKSKGV